MTPWTFTDWPNDNWKPLKNGLWNERSYSFSSFKESMLKSYIEISQVLLYMGVEIHLAKIRLMSDSDSDVSGNTFFRGELEKSLFLWHSLRQIGAKAEHHRNFHLHLHKLTEINKKKKERSSILHLYVREGVKKKRFFLGKSPKQRTPPTPGVGLRFRTQ